MYAHSWVERVDSPRNAFTDRACGARENVTIGMSLPQSHPLLLLPCFTRIRVLSPKSGIPAFSMVSNRLT